MDPPFKIKELEDGLSSISMDNDEKKKVDKIVRDLAQSTKKEIVNSGKTYSNNHYPYELFAKRFDQRLEQALKRASIEFSREKKISYKDTEHILDFYIPSIATVEIEQKTLLSTGDYTQCNTYSKETSLPCYLIHYGKPDNPRPFIEMFNPEYRKAKENLTTENPSKGAKKEKEKDFPFKVNPEILFGRPAGRSRTSQTKEPSAGKNSPFPDLVKFGVGALTGAALFGGAAAALSVISQGERKKGKRKSRGSARMGDSDW